MSNKIIINTNELAISLDLQYKLNNRLMESHMELNKKNSVLEEKTIELNDKNSILKEKNREIMESLDYAKFIQSAILPKEVNISNSLDNFIIWKPRDIVGGDFYYYRELNGAFILAVADCTGHGVPGAFMTMIANTVLNRIIEDICHDNPGRIIRELNLIIQQTLHHNSDKNKLDYQILNNGLDIGICYCPGKGQNLYFSGAKIPLYYYDGSQIQDIKPDNKSIGYINSDCHYTFKTHEIPFHKDSIFYLASDGFTSQLGGDKNFPFGRKRWLDLLSENCMKSLSEQSKALESRLSEYMKIEPQLDDITVLGFKILS